MINESAVADPVFRRLLGPRFSALPATVQTLHMRRGAATYVGEVQVARGTGVLSRLCAWATRLPPAGQGPVRVDIVAQAEEERWTRHMGRHAMQSRLWAVGELLYEQLGLVTFGFRLDVDEGVLTWAVARVSVFGLPLPARAFRQVSARESDEDGRYVFDVRAALPIVGPLVHYRGWLHVEHG